MTLPAGPCAPEPVAKPGPSRASTVGRHIVLIDDDALVLKTLASLLSRASFRIITAVGDGETALALLLAAEDVDIVYCDLMMKGMTGMELAAALTAKDPAKARKLVFMTGGAFTPTAQDFVARNSDRTVDKPFDIVSETRRRLT